MTPARLLIGACALAPLTTFLMQINPSYDLQAGWDAWPAHLVVASLYAALGFWIVIAGDTWLGTGVVMLAGHLLLLHGDLATMFWFALGAAGLTVFRVGLPLEPRERRLAVTVLTIAGLLQALYVLHQRAGWDIGWSVWGGAPLNPIGTLGNRDKVGAFLAITAPLMPGWAIPITALAVLSTNSLGALLGLGVGLMIRYRHGYSPAIIATLGAVASYTMVQSKGGLDAVWNRLEIWQIGLRDALASPIWGHGLGGWAARIPPIQTSPAASGYWLQAHNEPLQWLHETGVVGLAIAAAWVWAHRHAFLVPLAGASLGALAVLCLTYFPFHTPVIALLALCVIGLATAPEPAPTLISEGV